MLEIGLSHYLTLAGLLFTIGVFGMFLNRKNVIVILMSIELMLNAVNINLITFARYVDPAGVKGHLFAIFILTLTKATLTSTARQPLSRPQIRPHLCPPTEYRASLTLKLLNLEKVEFNRGRSPKNCHHNL